VKPILSEPLSMKAMGSLRGSSSWPT